MELLKLFFVLPLKMGDHKAFNDLTAQHWARRLVEATPSSLTERS